MASIINATTTNGVAVQGDNSGSLQLQTNNGTTAVTIDTSQNVGIGTSSPATKLQVVGTVSSIAGSVTATMSSDGTNGVFEVNGACFLRSTNSNPLVLGTNNTERMRIDSSGNLLVGSTSNVRGAKVNVAQGSSNGVMYELMQFTGGSGTGGNELGGLRRQTTIGVANSATTIYASLTFGELITVTGAGSGAIFADLLMASYNTVAVISSNTQQGSPASRTYSMSSGALRLTMGSATAMDITVQSLITGARGA